MRACGLFCLLVCGGLGFVFWPKGPKNPIAPGNRSQVISQDTNINGKASDSKLSSIGNEKTNRYSNLDFKDSKVVIRVCNELDNYVSNGNVEETNRMLQALAQIPGAASLESNFVSGFEYAPPEFISTILSSGDYEAFKGPLARILGEKMGRKARDFQDVKLFIADLDQNLKTSVIRNYVDELVRKDPEKAIALFDQAEELAVLDSRDIEGLFPALGAKDPLKFVRLVDAVPLESPSRNDIMQRFYMAWRETNQESLESYLNNLPSIEQRDEIVYAVAYRYYLLSLHDPGAKEKLRQELSKITSENWRRKSEWLKSK
jgi:hypothetical protein